jgi:hypothetical protein
LQNIVSTIAWEKTGKPESALDAGLPALSSAFVDWRYVYEANTLAIDLQLLTEMVLALYAVALDLKSDLVPPPHMAKYR